MRTLRSPKEVSQLGTLFKYCTNSPDVISGLFEHHKIRFTQPYSLNDPFEFNPAIRFDFDESDYRCFEYDGVIYPSNYLVNWLNLIESRINAFGILSLTDNPFSYEMWSHYANGHKGFLIEFNVGNKRKPRLDLGKGLPVPIHKVKYVSTNTVDFGKMCNKKGFIPESQFRDRIFLRKTNLWKYEREYRAVRRLDSCETYKPPAVRTSYRDANVYLFPMSIECILSVTFGVNAPVADKIRIIDLCAGHNISFLQALIPKDQQHEIKYVSIDSFGSLEAYLGMPPQLFTFDSMEIRYADQPVIRVSSPSEIPYYSKQKEDYDIYHAKRKARLRGAADVSATLDKKKGTLPEKPACGEAEEVTS